MSGPQPSIGVLITNYQARSQTEETVAAILTLHPSLSDVTQIVVVDDASNTPPSLPTDPRITLHINPQNLGYVRSVNVGARLLNTDLIVLFDCDARPTAPFATRLQQTFAAHSDIGAVAFVQNDHRPDLRPAAEPPPTLTEFIIGTAFHSRLPKPLRSLFSTPTAQKCIHSCCMAVRKSDFDAVGGFDESFDFLDADIDFSWRLLHRGLTNQVDPQLVCFHPGGGSPQSTGKRVLRYHQNRWRLLRKHGVAGPEDLVKSLLAVRHVFECLTLTCLSLLPHPRRSSFLDKLHTRRQLLSQVFHDYLPSKTPSLP